ncbi:hypothetical protein [Campylobacter ureolyticus]|uniref:hypothetical protein n=1 Tax=Campylobacter ureolyticus TaxID=827 RepID=UPI0022B5253A|nr:hypothetical protein [Campylobacter ureolyticus]MCZ6164225.1 hypothetical protein [Campylobacter ureolyticus]MCZ6166090.1 hypothetical protein [Campylobacter ureolyticus]
MKRIIFLLIPLFMFANVDRNIIESSAYGEQVVKEQDTVFYNEEKKNENYRREAIYNFILFNNSVNEPTYTAKTEQLINFVEENATNLKTEIIKKVDNNMTITGYCLVRDDINVGKQPSAGRFLCNTNIGQLEIFGNLTPVNEMATLIFDPTYIDFSGWRYKVITSRVLNEARSSYNIATFVNDRKITEIALESTSKGADVFKTQSSQYLEELKQSRKKQSVEYVNVGTGSNSYVAPIQNTNTEKPRATDYIVKGAIDLVSETIKTTADVFKRDLPYLYEIKGGSKVYIDLVINKNGEKIQ